MINSGERADLLNYHKNDYRQNWMTQSPITKIIRGGPLDLCKSQKKYRACASGLKKMSCRIVKKEKISSSRNQRVAKGFCITHDSPKISCVSRD